MGLLNKSGSLFSPFFLILFLTCSATNSVITKKDEGKSIKSNLNFNTDKEFIVQALQKLLSDISEFDPGATISIFPLTAEIEDEAHRIVESLLLKADNGGIAFLKPMKQISINSNDFGFAQNFQTRADFIFLVSNETILLDIFEQVENVCSQNLLYCRICRIFFIVPNSQTIERIFQSDSKFLTRTSLKLDSQLYFISNSKKLLIHDLDAIATFQITELYGIKNNSVSMTQEGWSPIGNLIDHVQRIGVRRGNFGKNLLTCSVQNDPDYIYESHLEMINGKLTLDSGFSVQVFLDLEYALNFTTVVIEAEGWPSKTSNGSWEGVARQIQVDEVDISVSHSTFTPERVESFAFLHPTLYGYLKAFFRQPRASFFHDVYKHAFDDSLWLSLIGIWLLICLAIGVVFGIKLYYYRQIFSAQPNLAELKIRFIDEEFTRDSLLWAIGTISQQGWHFHPKAASLRIIFITASLCSLITYIAFSASLVSTLTSEPVSISTFQDLTKTNTKFIVDMHVPHIDIFLQPLKVELKTESLIIEDAITRINETESAFITHEEGLSTVYHRLNHTDQKYCEIFSTVTLNQGRVPTGMFIKKGSEYREVFNCKILMTLERGLNHKHLRDYQKAALIQCVEKIIHFRAELDLEDVRSAFALLANGIMLSFVLLIIEKLVCYFLGPGTQKIQMAIELFPIKN